MPAIIARQIASQIAALPAEENVRQVVATGVQTAAASGYDGEIAVILAEVCEDLQRRIAGEGEPQRRSSLQTSLELVRGMADECQADASDTGDPTDVGHPHSDR